MGWVEDAAAMPQASALPTSCLAEALKLYLPIVSIAVPFLGGYLLGSLR